MSDKNTIKLIGNFELQFDDENDMQAFIENMSIVGKIDYKAYKSFYGEEKMFQEISYEGKVEDEE